MVELNKIYNEDCMETMKRMEDNSINLVMIRNKKGRFVRGVSASPKTQFKKGQHWREHKPYWNKEWLVNQYIVLGKSASEIAKEQGCKTNNILYFLKKLKIPIRNTSEARKVKYWGQSGVDNPMWNMRGELNPMWLGGITPERQSFYQSKEWKIACSSVWKRDMATCQRCGIQKNTDMPFHIHHIKSFKDKELRADLDNLILLCESCHHFIHSKKNIERLWIK